MPINSNTFNSRVTSESLEAKFRQVFPAQGGAELIQDLYAAGTIQPVIDFSSVAEGSVLPELLQTAINYGGNSHFRQDGTESDLITNTGFWRVIGVATYAADNGEKELGFKITDGVTPKIVWEIEAQPVGTGSPTASVSVPFDFVVFLKTGETLRGGTNSSTASLSGSYRQIADVSGNLVNPVGFTFS